MAPLHHSPFTLAVAIFVKTPGLSPLKTRLAKTVGKESAQEFYRLACKAITHTLTSVQNESEGTVQAFWAVAEEDDNQFWADFPIIRQGPGELGSKLNHIYTALLERYNAVALIGADTPQITSVDILKTRDILLSKDFVTGPASDGGFYLFAGRKPVEPQIWSNTQYSQSDTLERLLIDIEKIGSVSSLQRYSDVDTFEDLTAFLQEADIQHSQSIDHQRLKKFVIDLVEHFS